MPLLTATKRMPPTLHLAQGLNPVVTYLKESGINPSLLLSQANVSPKILHNPNHHVTTHQELQFTELAIEALKQPDLGLTLGARYHLSSYGVLGLAIMTSTNILDAARVLFKNILMTWTYMHWTVSVEKGAAIVAEQPLKDLGKCQQYMLDRGLIAIYLIFAEALGWQLLLREVNLTQQQPDYADRYQQLFNCPINFGQRTNCFSFDESYLYEKLPQADPDSNIIFQTQCEKVCHQLGDRLCFADLIRQEIMTLDSRECTLGYIASKLHLIPRTIQRRLAAEDTSFHTIHKEVRCSMAIEYLESTGLRIEEIAIRLGYNEVSSFCHAFKIWTGKSPSDYRALAREEAN